MRFAREKRWMLGLLAFLAPLPLPFNGVIGWLSLTAYLLATLLFLVRVGSSTYRCLRPWVMNVLGLVYIPVLAFEMSSWWKGQQLMRSLIHLILFALVVKLFSLARERDYWHALLAIFFLFLAAMGTSVHPSVMIYLLAFLFSSLLVLTRFTAYEVMAEHGVGKAAGRDLRLRRFVVATGVVVLLAAVPMFALLPRLKQPYLFGPGVGNASSAAGGGFTGGLELDTIGTVRTGRAVVLRFSTNAPTYDASQIRFKAATYDLFRRNSWSRGQRISQELKRGPDGFFRLAPGATGLWLEVWQSKGGGRELALPAGTAAFDVRVESVGVDDSGVVTLPLRPSATFNYKAGLQREGSENEAQALMASRLDLDDATLSQRVRDLAEEVMGKGEVGERVERLERHLMHSYRYTLDLGSREADDPIDEFLFERRSGHCEYFATSMVLMLRSQGIPARMVSGYLGAELNPLEGYHIVRQSNAHAWVEALIEGKGWSTFDPTPSIGRPQASNGGLLQLASQAYDYLLFRWDRYVLTYGFIDQIDTLMRARDLLREMWNWFGKDDQELAAAGEASSEGAVEPAAIVDEPPAPVWRWGAIAAIALVGLLWLWRARVPWSATTAYRSLRSGLADRDEETEVLAPLEVERRVVASCPEAAAEARRIVRLYLEESFASRALTEGELADLRNALGTVRRALRKAA